MLTSDAIGNALAVAARPAVPIMGSGMLTNKPVNS